MPGNGLHLDTQLASNGIQRASMNSGSQPISLDPDLEARVQLSVHLMEGVQILQPVVKKLGGIVRFDVKDAFNGGDYLRLLADDAEESLGHRSKEAGKVRGPGSDPRVGGVLNDLEPGFRSRQGRITPSGE